MIKDKEPADDLLFKVALFGVMGLVLACFGLSHALRTTTEQREMIEAQKQIIRQQQAEREGFEKGVRAVR